MPVSRVPLVHPLLEGKSIGKDNEPWTRWLTNVSNLLSPPNWDSNTFDVVFSGLTEVGNVSKTGNFVRHGELLFFDVVVDPSPGGTSASTFGITSFKLPDLFVELGSETKIVAIAYGTLNAFKVESPGDLGMGYVDINTLNAFPPAWGATGDKISITGWVRIEGE